MAAARKPEERGVALLIALLLIIVMSTVAYAVTDDIQFSIRRSANQRISAQMTWYALGAEAMARKVVWASWKASPQRSTLADPWAREGVAFPIDGGSMAGRISDAGTCFNLNSVAESGPTGHYVASEGGRKQFVALLVALDYSRQQSQALADAVVDWIDTDSAPSGAGAEDDTYGLRAVPYRTGGTLLAETSELRAIAGFNEDIYQRLQPLVCALPTPDLTRLNVNTLRPDQAALLVMLTDGALRLSEAERMIAGRPAGGFTSLDRFFAQEALAGIELSEATRRQFVPRSEYFQAETLVKFHGAAVTVNTLLHVDSGGRVSTLARRMGGLD